MVLVMVHAIMILLYMASFDVQNVTGAWKSRPDVILMFIDGKFAQLNLFGLKISRYEIYPRKSQFFKDYSLAFF